MGNRTSEITPDLQEFIDSQPIYFVASAPLESEGHVNLSPKGLDTLRVLSPTRIAYLDLTGSGNETAAHVAQNARLTVMFCAFTGRPRIVRLYCRARVVVRGDEEWEFLAGRFRSFPGVRQFFIGDVEIVQSSCGFGVPRMEMVGERDGLTKWAEAKSAGELVAYRATKNRTSLDGLGTPRTDRGSAQSDAAD